MALILSGDSTYAEQSDVDMVETDLLNLRDYTLLATYPTLKQSGTIDLSESADNFEELVFQVSDSVGNTINHFSTLPVFALTVGVEYGIMQEQSRYSRWIYTNSTTFTYSVQSGTWVRNVWGKRRVS